MNNPFDDQDANFLVLRNGDDQYSLWPQFVPVPNGWSTVHGPDSRQDCLDFVNENWTSMLPNRVRELNVSR